MFIIPHKLKYFRLKFYEIVYILCLSPITRTNANKIIVPSPNSAISDIGWMIYAGLEDHIGLRITVNTGALNNTIGSIKNLREGTLLSLGDLVK